MKKLLVLSFILLIASCSKSSKTQLDQNDLNFFSKNNSAKIATITANCYVDNNGNDSNTGANITNIPAGTGPKQHIQACINAVSNGETVIAAQGTYVENIQFPIPSTNTPCKEVTVASNFINTGDPADIHNTVIDGNHNGTVVTIWCGENNNTQLTGFTIKNGAPTTTQYTNIEAGGGVVSRSSASPNLNNLIIKDNVMDSGYGGGGIYAYNDSNVTQLTHIILENIYLENNTTSSISVGGGVRLTNVKASMKNIKVINNTPQIGGSGGGIWMNNVTVIDDLEKLYIYGNSAGAAGGILIGNIPPNNTTINIKNSVIANNYTTYPKGTPHDCSSIIGAAGMEINIGATPNVTVNIINSTISSNYTQGAPSAGGIAVNIAPSNTTSFVNIVSSIFWGNKRNWQSVSGAPEEPNQILVNYSSATTNSTLSIYNSDIEGATAGVWSNHNSGPYTSSTSTWSTQGNINIDPLFVNAVPIPTPQGSENYSITANSPCAGTGVNSITIGGQNIVAPTDDIIFAARPMPSGTNVDMGAYEILQKTHIGPAPLTPIPDGRIISKPLKPRVHL